MPKISYPFAAVPNQIARGGHGLANLSVLTVLLSHGKTKCSIKTLAQELGCDKKTILPAIRYWKEEGPKNGIEILTEEKFGCPTVYEINIQEMREPHPKTGQVTDQERDPKTGEVEECTSPENGSGGNPKTGHLPDPKTGDKEEHKKIEELNTDAPASDTPSQKQKKKQPVQEVFDLFHELTGWIPRWNNQTERTDAESLLREHSLDDLRKILVFARKPENVNDRFFPKIYKPSDLTTKWGNVADKMPKASAHVPEKQPWDEPTTEHDPNAGLRALETSARDILAKGGDRNHPVVLMATKRGIRIEDLALQK